MVRAAIYENPRLLKRLLMKRTIVTTLTTIAFVFAPVIAFAHPGHGGADGMIQGFAHPLSGIDHVLAMVAVGLLAAQLGGRALWLVPLSFVSMMAVAGAVAMEWNSGSLHLSSSSGWRLPFALACLYSQRWRSPVSLRCSTAMCMVPNYLLVYRIFFMRQGSSGRRRCFTRPESALGFSQASPEENSGAACFRRVAAQRRCLVSRSFRDYSNSPWHAP